MVKRRGEKDKSEPGEDNEKKPRVSPRVYIIGVITAALVLIAILAVISFLGEPKEVDLEDLGEYEGEEVIVKGIVVEMEKEEYSTKLLIFQDGTVTRAYVEERTDKAEVNDRVRVRAEVYRSGSTYALQVVGENSIEVLGDAEPVEVQPGEIGEHADEYVMMDGVVVGFSENDWGGGTARLLGIPDIESAGNWSATVDVKFSDRPKNLNSTDRLTVCGVVRENDDGAYLYVYDTDAIVSIEKGFWAPKNMTLGMLSELIEKGGDESSVFVVEVFAYLKYQPGGYGSVTLTDHPTDGEFTLKMDTRDMVCDQEISKGDLLHIRGTVEYDREGMKYVLLAQWAEVVEYHGIWEMTVEELVSVHYLFENANVKVNGSLLLENNVSYLCNGEHRVRVNARPKDWGYGVELVFYGTFRFDEEGLFYYLDISEP